MNEASDRNGMQAVLDRLTRLEERVANRGPVIDAEIADLKASINTMAKVLEQLRDDVRDAKTGLRVGMAIMTTMGGVAGWVLSHLGK